MTQDNEIAYEWVTAAAVVGDAFAAVLPAIQADALRKAADRLDLPGSTATGYYASEWDGGYREAERHIEVWLNREADRIEKGE